MALDKTDGGTTRKSGRGRRHWAYMRYKTGGHYETRLGPRGRYRVWVKADGPKVGRWVKVGSQLYNDLRTKYGVKPIVVRTGKRPSGTPNKAKTTNTGKGIGGAVGGAIKGASGGAGGGGKGGSGGGRKKRGHGVSSARARGTTRAINTQLGSTKAGKRLGGGYADALAGIQFDAPIRDIKTLIERLGPQNQQAINDLSQWYGDVSALNAQAGARSGQIAQDVAGNQDQAVQGLMAALGGGGNAANAQIAQLQANDGGYQRALGGIQEQYHANMDPILAHAEAAAKEREQRLNLTQMQDYQLQLADLLGQRGQAKAANQLEVDKYNNELAQQWFQNRLAKLNANLGAQAAGVDMAYKTAQIRQNQQAARQANRANKGGPANWNRLDPPQRDELIQRAIGLHQNTAGQLVPSRSYVSAQRLLSSWLKHPVGSGRNKGLLTALYQYYH